jgi:long-chain fatty acid transport protein
VGNAFGPDANYDGSGIKNFVIPQVGYVRSLNDRWAFGIAAYGNGGMNTIYDVNPYGRFGASGRAGVNLEQLFVSPTLAYRIADGQSIGVSFDAAYQLFKAQGVGIFGGFSSNPAAISNNGVDHAFGAGGRIGYQGQITPDLTIGAFWQSKTYTGRFKKYSGLFADHGAFDVPSAYGIGLAYKLTENLDAALDLERIEYSDVASVGNSLSALFAGRPFGASNGPGFGWRDANVVRVGLNYTVAPQWQIRAGWGYSSEPVRASQTFLNILAPGVVQNHVAAGVTWTSEGGTEFSGSVVYAPTTHVDGKGSIPVPFGGGEANVKLSEVVIGLAAGWHLEP